MCSTVLRCRTCSLWNTKRKSRRSTLSRYYLSSNSELMQAAVSFNDSSDMFYVLNMYQSWTDQATWIESAPSTVTDMRNLSSVWARAARLVFTDILAPNNRDTSIFRSSLIANGWEYISLEYYGELPLMKACLT
jgi:hypothetical protein